MSQAVNTEEINPKATPLASAELTKSILELINRATQYKQLKRGANEATKSLNRGQAQLIIMAADTDPIEILMHIPLLCEDKNVIYVFVPSKQSLGRACGVSRSVICCSIIEDDDSQLGNEIRKIQMAVEKLVV